jgi:hypothetical protein
MDNHWFVITSPSVLNVPVDLALGVVIPYHFYSGMSHICHDYLHHESYYGLVKIALALLAVLMVAGFLNLNLRGDGTLTFCFSKFQTGVTLHRYLCVPLLLPYKGLTEAVKRLWRDTDEEAPKKKK